MKRGSVMLLALLAFAAWTFPQCVADEPQPPAQPPAGLTLRFHGKLPRHLDMSRIEGLIGSFLRGEEQERKVAEEKMIDTGPLVVLAVRERLAVEADAGVRERLEALTKKLQADTPTNAKVIFHFAQALATVAKSGGPLDAEDPGLERWRAMAKIFHFSYLDPAHYGETIDHSMSIVEGHKDLIAAVAEYKEAAAMWERLAAAAKDPAEAAQNQAEAAKCKDGAAAAEKKAAEIQ